MSVNGDTAVIGAFGDDDGGAGSGSAYVCDLFRSASFSLLASLPGGRASAVFVAGPIVTIETPAASTPAQVAAALADAVNAETPITDLGIVAEANGDTLLLRGVHRDEVYLLQDSDGDRLGNDVETGTGHWVTNGDTGTDPFDADTDDDGLLDGVETHRASYADPDDTGTDPHDADTDGDSYSDGEEVARGYDPLDPASMPPPGIPTLGTLGRLLLALLLAAAARRASSPAP